MPRRRTSRGWWPPGTRWRSAIRSRSRVLASSSSGARSCGWSRREPPSTRRTRASPSGSQRWRSTGSVPRWRCSTPPLASCARCNPAAWSRPWTSCNGRVRASCSSRRSCSGRQPRMPCGRRAGRCGSRRARRVMPRRRTASCSATWASPRSTASACATRSRCRRPRTLSRICRRRSARPRSTSSGWRWSSPRKRCGSIPPRCRTWNSSAALPGGATERCSR